MEGDQSASYLRRIWHSIKGLLSEPSNVHRGRLYVTAKETADEAGQSAVKRPRLELVAESVESSFDQSSLLEVMKRLLTCSVCLEVRRQANQCQNGHLICVNCSLYLQQSCTGKDLTCPVCRVPLSGVYQRSLLAEQLVSELPSTCRYCACSMSLRQLERHEAEVCLSREVSCQFALFGCGWRGLARQRRLHETNCPVGLSPAASVSDLVHANFKKQLAYYERRNAQWNNVLSRLRERHRGLNMFMKHLVLSRSGTVVGGQSTFVTSRLCLLDQHQFLIKFVISRSKRPQDLMTYRLKSTSKHLHDKKISVNFFLHSIRYDDDLFELDDNMHSHNFCEDDRDSGEYSVTFTKRSDCNGGGGGGSPKADLEGLPTVNLAVKDSLYLEAVFSVDISETGVDHLSQSLNGQQESPESLSHTIGAGRGGLGGSNGGNLVVALISSGSLAAQPVEEDSEEQEEEQNVAAEGDEDEGEDVEEVDEEECEEEVEEEVAPEGEQEPITNDRNEDRAPTQNESPNLMSEFQ